MEDSGESGIMDMLTAIRTECITEKQNANSPVKEGSVGGRCLPRLPTSGSMGMASTVTELMGFIVRR